MKPLTLTLHEMERGFAESLERTGEGVATVNSPAQSAILSPPK